MEKHDKLGIHPGEFNHLTGEQTKPAKPGRTTPK
ncbi:colicin E3/pyocin S6 family cytotoxin [Pseudomonas sp. Root562]|nr:colicin E3/pyocin S6 family cytotoxin [Pseudomonas sp. Root562]